MFVTSFHNNNTLLFIGCFTLQQNKEGSRPLRKLVLRRIDMNVTTWLILHIGCNDLTLQLVFF